MSNNESIVVEQIVRSLSFEVVAIPGQAQKVVPSSTPKATPLNVKVRVKKKHEGGLQHGVLAIPVKSSDEIPQRIRLVSSDQTIMSFNAVMEDIDFDSSRARKPNLPNIDNYPFTPSTTEACQSEGALKKKFLLSKAENDSNKKKDIFGRCKPGGCLDPPFGEDKYSYEPSKEKQKTQIQDTTERKRTSSIFSNKLFKKKKKSKTDKGDVKKGESESNQSVISLYETGSLQKSAYSNSIITYPSPTNGSDDKVIQDRQKSPRNSVTRKSTESDNGSLYIVPKKTRASLEKEEAKLKSERDDTKTDLSNELENKGDVSKFDDDGKFNTEQQQFDFTDTIDEKNIFSGRPGMEKYVSGDLVNSALESTQGDNAASGVKTGLITAGVAATTAGIAAIVLTDLKDNDKTTYEDTSVDKVYDDTNNINKTDLNDIGNNIDKTTTGNIDYSSSSSSSGSSTNEDQLSTNTKDYNYSEINKYEDIITEDSKVFPNKDSSEITEALPSAIHYPTPEGIIGDTNDFLNETQDIDNDKHVSKVIGNIDKMPEDIDTDKFVSKDRANINKMPEDIDTDKLVSKDRANINKMPEDIDTDTLVSKDRGNINKMPEDTNTDKFVSKDRDNINKMPEDIDTDKLVSKDRGNLNKIFFDDLSDIQKFDNEIASLDTSDKIDKQVFKSDNLEETTHVKTVVFTDLLTDDDRESDSKFQPSSISDTNFRENNNISVTDNISDTMSRNDGDNLSVLKKQKDLQDLLQKGKDFFEIDETSGNYMQQSKNINDNNGKSIISNGTVKRDISSDRLGDNNDLSENVSKRHQLQPERLSTSDMKGYSDTDGFIKDDESIADKIRDDLQSSKEIKIKKSADGDKQKKRKKSAEQIKTKIDLGFHTYTNENNESILKSFDSKTPPSRYPKDSVVVTNCDLQNPFELKVPFGTEQYLWIQVKDNENFSKTLPGTTKSSNISLPGKTQKQKLHKINEQMRAVKLINKDIVKAQMKDIYGTYENELVPLQQSLTQLKQDVDVLILQQKAIRNNLLSKRLKIQGNRKCACVKKF